VAEAVSTALGKNNNEKQSILSADKAASAKSATECGAEVAPKLLIICKVMPPLLLQLNQWLKQIIRRSKPPKQLLTKIILRSKPPKQLLPKIIIRSKPQSNFRQK
jgi:hypothetical protein